MNKAHVFKNVFVNVEIQTAVALKDSDAIQRIIDAKKDHLNAKGFDATVQNLLVLQFLTTKNINVYFYRMEKSGVQIEEQLDLLSDASDKATATSAAYALYNCVVFRKVNRRHASFADDELIDARFLKAAEGSLPSLPVLKLFLSKMNFFFNQNMHLRFLEHGDEITKLSALEATVKGWRKAGFGEQKLFLVSIFYGSTLYRFPSNEQWCYGAVEARMLYLVMTAIQSLFLRMSGDFASAIVELKENLADLKQIPTASFQDSAASTKVITEALPVQKSNYDIRLSVKLGYHLRAVIAFLEILQNFQKDTNFTELVRFVNADFMECGRLIAKYQASIQNLLALANVKNGHFLVANYILRKIVTNAKLIVNSNKKVEQTSFLDLTRLNNQIAQQSNYYNLGLSFAQAGLHDQALTVLGQVVNHFRNQLSYWYRVGVSNFKLMVRAIEQGAAATVATGDAESYPGESRPEYLAYRAYRMSTEKPVQRYLDSAFDASRETVLGESVKTLKNTHAANAIYAFEKCRLLIDKQWDDESIQVQKTKGKQKEISTATRVFVYTTRTNYLISTAEHLAFLYLVTGKPMQCLRVVGKVAGMKALSKEKLLLLLQYKLKALQMLGKPQLLEDTLREVDAVAGSKSGRVEYLYMGAGRRFRGEAALGGLAAANAFMVGMCTQNRARLEKLSDQVKSLSESKLAAEADIREVCQQAMVAYYSGVNFNRGSLQKAVEAMGESS